MENDINIFFLFSLYFLFLFLFLLNVLYIFVFYLTIFAATSSLFVNCATRNEK